MGWGVLEVSAVNSTLVSRTMNVMAYPEIWCRHDGTRWWLVRPTKSADPTGQLSNEPREAQESIITQLAPPREGYRIPGCLWKRVDDYFIVDNPEDRYDPSKIKGYNYDDNDFSVDEQASGSVGQDGRRLYCGPDQGEPGGEWPCRLPQHASERIEVIALKPVAVEETVPAVVPVREQ